MRRHRLHLNVTDKCNIRCVHCYWEEFGAHKDPSIQAIDQILHKFKTLARSYQERGRHILTIGGGEPTVRRDLEKIIALAVRRKFKVRLVTNATLIDERRARSLKKAGLKVAQVSLDGATEETHDRVRGKGNWARTMKGIAALKKARIFTVLSYVLLPGLNMEEAPLLLDLVRKLDVAGAKFARPVREGQAVLHKIRIQGDYWTAFNRIVQHANDIHYKRLLLFFDPLAHLLPVTNPNKTKGLWGLATDLCQCNNTELIEVNGGSGDIYYCRIRKGLGNIWSDDLVRLWQNHPLLVSLRRKEPAGACNGCAVWSSCRGGCPAVTYGNTQEPMLQDSDCDRVQKQPEGPVMFTRGLFAGRKPSLRESIQNLARIMKDAAYWVALK